MKFSPPSGDVRMRGFQHRTQLADVVRLLEEELHPLDREEVDLHQAAGRILFQDVLAPCSVPGFDRAAMDGFAVKALDIAEATPSHPRELDVLGDSWPGVPFAGQVAGGQAVRIMTGAPVPPGADAIAPVEIARETNSSKSRKVLIQEAVKPGRHLGRRGEDIQTGQLLLRAGRVLRPQDVGVLASVGVSPVGVVSMPSVAILVTGNELLPCGSRPEGFRIVDSNSVMLDALLRRDGIQNIRIQMLADTRDEIRTAISNAAEDVIFLSGGSSVGVEDYAPGVLAELGEIRVHGLALRPAGPTGVGFLGSRPVFLLPGNPVSCLCAYDLLAGPAVRRLAGRPMDQPHPRRHLPLAAPISSVQGRTDYVRVLIQDNQVIPLATSGASILTSTTRADGFVLVPVDLAEYPAGTTVEVYLYC